MFHLVYKCFGGFVGYSGRMMLEGEVERRRKGEQRDEMDGKRMERMGKGWMDGY